MNLAEKRASVKSDIEMVFNLVLRVDFRMIPLRIRGIKFGLNHKDYKHARRQFWSLFFHIRSACAAMMLLLFDTTSFGILCLIDLATIFIYTRCWFMNILLSFWLPRCEYDSYYLHDYFYLISVLLSAYSMP